MEQIEQIQLKLYILENSPTSRKTIARLKNCLEGCLDKYRLDIIDIIKNPALTVKDQVFASPTLIKEIPLPSKRLVGKIPVKNLIEKLHLEDFKKFDCKDA